ncbi:hypothetical protein MLD38_004619 [Melastoma candidum]|nr:hypothetical protein MLD38_004619 [Melastoma candidum]
MYFASGANDSAMSIFQPLQERDIVIWTEMITAHSRMGDSESAFSYFAGMFKEGHKIDSFALSGVLSACADMATHSQGETIHSLSVKAGLGVDMAVCGSLVNMYAKNGDLQSAESIFREVSDPDLMCWNSMLGGYGNHGLAEMALRIFEQILLHGLIPDQVTFLSALSACNHGFLVEKGKLLWNCMEEFGIRPGIKHYSCIIDLLSRAGLLNEAEEVIRKSPAHSSKLELWRTLLGACVNHQNLVVGVQAAKQVLSLNPLDGAAHILLSNLYAAVGKWEDAAAQIRSMREMKIDKAPGLSWIDAPNNCTGFSSGNLLQPKIDETQLTMIC